jgi:uncharacterized protein (DUF885 family)
MIELTSKDKARTFKPGPDAMACAVDRMTKAVESSAAAGCEQAKCVADAVKAGLESLAKEMGKDKAAPVWEFEIKTNSEGFPTNVVARQKPRD